MSTSTTATRRDCQSDEHLIDAQSLVEDQDQIAIVNDETIQTTVEQELENSAPATSSRRRVLASYFSSNWLDINIERRRSSFTVTTLRQTYFARMCYIVIEYFVLIGLTFISFALFQNSTTKLSRPPAAQPFFSSDSIVRDYYNGDISAAMRYCKEQEISIIFYYAPWDAECQYLRTEIEAVAKFLKRDARVVAVNCWQPGSECATLQRRKFGATVWPGILINYGNEVLLYRGQRRASYLINFLNKLRKPFFRITNANDLNHLIAHYDVIVYGSVNTTSHYRTLYKTILTIHEHNPSTEIALAVSTSKITNLNTRLPMLKIYSTNRTMTYTQTNWTVNELYRFVAKNSQSQVRWLSPPGFGKSSLLASAIQNEPSLLIFTPRNPLSFLNPYFDSLRAINLIYNNCGNEINRTSKILHSFLTNVPRSYNNLKLNLSQCLDTLDDSKPANDQLFCSKPVTLSGTFNSCLDYDNRHLKCSNLAGIEDKDVADHQQSDFIRTIAVPIVEKIGQNDYRSSENLIKSEHNNLCRLLLPTLNHYKKVFPLAKKLLRIHLSPDLNGLACRFNGTLKMSLIDSIEYGKYANNLGIDIANRPDQSAVVIVDAKNENHFIMKNDVTFDNIKNFIVNFTSNSLSVEYPSEVNQNEALYSIGNCKTAQMNRTQSVCIPELTTETFLPSVMAKNTTAIVLFYSSYCAFCNDASRALLYVAKYFSPFADRMKFYRIDGEKNPLPWAYNVYHYPTILFFPAKRKEDSRAYPLDAVRKVPKLTNFILTNLEPPLKLEMMWTLCKKNHNTLDASGVNDLNKCIALLRKINFNFLKISQNELSMLRMTGFKLASAFYVKQLQHLNRLFYELNLLLRYSSPLTLEVTSLKRIFYSLHQVWERIV